MRYQTTYVCELGTLLLESDGEALVGLWMEGQKHGKANERDAIHREDLPIFHQTKQWLDLYFAGKNPEINVPLRPEGTAFQKKVWEELRKIPYGETTTYGTIANALHIRSGQAVGGAVGRNPISILIPCHRVISRDHSLTGYAGGIEKKVRLLELENIDVSKMKYPKRG